LRYISRFIYFAKNNKIAENTIIMITFHWTTPKSKTLPPGISYLLSLSSSIPKPFNDFLVVRINDVTPSNKAKESCFIFSLDDREPADLL